MVGQPSRGGVGAALSMFMTAAERVPPPSPSRPDIGRSPFVRLRELLGAIEPGKPPISLAVGEPQHRLPAFVGPILAAHIDEFGRYPMNKGLDAFCEAAIEEFAEGAIAHGQERRSA